MIFINFFIVYLQKQPPEGSIAEVPEACNLIEKEIPSQMFSTEFWEMFRNTYFVEHLETAASVSLTGCLISFLQLSLWRFPSKSTWC